MNRAEMTPKDNVLEALHFYSADAKLDDHGVSHIFLTFPDIYHAAAWVRAMGLTEQVRLLAVEWDNMTRFNQKVEVIYEF